MIATLLEAGLSSGIVAAIWFAIAIALLDRFDILQPRGDSIGVSGALVVAGAVVAGLLPIAVLSSIALLVGHAGRWRGSGRRILNGLLVRATALAVLWALSPWWSDARGIQEILWLVFLPVAYLVSELAASQILVAVDTKRPLSRLLAGNFRRQAPMLAAEASAAILAIITYQDMGAWSLVLVVALLLMMRQSLALLLEIRETYQMTVQVLVEAAEGQDARRQGHAERTAQIARSIAAQIGLPATEIERISYAALLHDIDALSDNYTGDGVTGASSDVVSEAAFFDDILPVLRLCDGRPQPEDLTEPRLATAMLVALASDIDSAQWAEVGEAHTSSAVARVSSMVPAATKARVVAAALELGYRTPAVS